MNGKKAKMLRKQAGGNEATYALLSPKGVRTLDSKCSRRKYKDLKALYRLIGM